MIASGPSGPSPLSPGLLSCTLTWYLVVGFKFISVIRSLLYTEKEDRYTKQPNLVRIWLLIQALGCPFKVSFPTYDRRPIVFCFHGLVEYLSRHNGAISTVAFHWLQYKLFASLLYQFRWCDGTGGLCWKSNIRISSINQYCKWPPKLGCNLNKKHYNFTFNG